jgi:hypothetical protein
MRPDAIKKFVLPLAAGLDGEFRPLSSQSRSQRELVIHDRLCLQNRACLSWKSFRAAACTSGPGKRAGYFLPDFMTSAPWDRFR